MAKNREKYRYFEIGLAWDSFTLAALEKDAKLHQIEDQPAKLIALRLTEYYKLAEMGVFVPGITERMQSEAASTMNGHQNGARGGSATSAAPSPYTDLTNAPLAEPSNPEDDAADYWGTM
jgi:hypothetical protein